MSRGGNSGRDLRESDEVIQEHSYVVARGVRALALVGKCEADPLTMLRAATRLEALGDPAVVPFVVDLGAGHADCGFAAAGWVLDLYRWLALSDPAVVPPEQRERITGLLLGYSVEAIRLFEDRLPGRFFSGPTSSPASGSR